MKQKLFNSLISAALWLALINPAHALPVIEFEFIGSGQTVSPTDTVVMRGAVTNISSEALSGAVGGGFILFPSQINDQYFDPVNPPAPFPPGVISLAPGERLEWIINNFVAFPITGNLGDPVPLGDYVFPLTNISTTFFVPAGPNSFTVTAQKSNAADFIWTVQAPGTSVPEPNALALALFSLAALWLTARRAAQVR